MRPIAEIVAELGLGPDAWSPHGRWIAKVDPARAPVPSRPGSVVLVTGITPSAHGVGKSVTMLALGAALRRRGVRSIACLRQPSLGPVFGIKGGGAGGGRATAEPMTEVNLGLTGDLDAVTNAHNLLASAVDNHLHFGNPLDLDPARIVWPRALDLEDRALREIELGRGTTNGPTRPGSFVITPASEVTAILGLARTLADLKSRFERIVVGRSRSGRLVRAGELGVAGAMAVLLRHALAPNLVQTPEGSPVLVHGGPFGNLSYGTTTANAIHLGRAVADVVLVEAGFGSDLGGEKFVDLFGPLTGLAPSAAVLVVSVPVLRAHAGPTGLAGDLGPGLENLDHHVRTVRRFGLEPVVALNRFPGDAPEEVRALRAFLADRAVRVEESTGYADGGAGAEALADAVSDAAAGGRPATPLYRPADTLLRKLEIVGRDVYGGDGVDLAETAAAELGAPEASEFAAMPVCLAKTPLSLSEDPKRLGRPRGFRLHVRDLVPAAGAGYVVALLGTVQTMPGLPREPRYRAIDLAPDGTVQGVT